MPTLVERPEISSFITAWQSKPKEQVIEELASLSLETKRIPDPYHFLITRDGELFSPSAQCRIKDVVEDKTGPLGSLEYQAVCSIEEWAASSNEGAIAWVSPPHPGVYPASKIIISEIEHTKGNKKLFNRAIILDFGERKCLEFAQNLAQFSQNRPLLSQPDQIRSTPFILNTQGKSWINILEQLIDDPALWNGVRKGEDQRAKKEALREATRVQKDLFIASEQYMFPSDETQMAVLQILGPKPGSCPIRFARRKTAFRTFSENARTFGGSISKDPDYCQNCPVCGGEIACVVRVGGSCPKCGAVKRCG